MEAALLLQVTSSLFVRGLSAARNAYKKRKQRQRLREQGLTEEDYDRGGVDAKAELNLNLDFRSEDAGLGWDSLESVGVAVGVELAMKARQNLFGARKRRTRAFTGLSEEFAKHRRETRLELSGVAANQQSASQAIAEELVGVRTDLRYNADQLTRGVAEVRTDLGEIIGKVDGIWNTVENGLLEVNYAIRDGTAVIYKSLGDLQGEMEGMKSSMLEARQENYQYFTNVSSRLDNLEASIMRQSELRDRSNLQNYLRMAKMHLNSFTGAGGEDFGHLDKARDCCINILALQPQKATLDAQFMAGVISIAASYTKVAHGKSPAEAKKYVFDADFLNITQSFSCVWADHSGAHDSTWTKVVTYLLDVASSICLLPPEGVLLPSLDTELVEAFSMVCCLQPSLLDRFPEVGGAALRSRLQAQSLDDLCRTSRSQGVDTSLCDNRVDVIQALFDERKAANALLALAPARITEGEPDSPIGKMERLGLESDDEEPDTVAPRGLSGARLEPTPRAWSPILRSPVRFTQGGADRSNADQGERVKRPARHTDEERLEARLTPAYSASSGVEPGAWWDGTEANNDASNFTMNGLKSGRTSH